jgi:hypothetical protein
VAYNKDEILQQALSAIETEECVTIEEVLLFLPISKQTFYNLQLDEVDELKEALNGMKVKLKKKMRRNWRNSDNATLQIAEFKLIASDDERDKLNTQKVQQDTTHSFKDKPTINLIMADGSKANDSSH